VLLSTDTGGTGLNLQVADTVINLEIPWNPAVLEQRIARVHRMGQSKPVRVILLVTRNSIEERVLKTVEMKRSLFAGVFDGESDEVSFTALGQPQFLQSVRDLIGESQPASLHEPAETEAAGTALVESKDAHTRLLLAGVQFLEALAEVMGQNGTALPPDLAARAGYAIRRVFENCDQDE
jgi:hypothetical protein